jgi:fumarate reductase subunit C
MIRNGIHSGHLEMAGVSEFCNAVRFCVHWKIKHHYKSLLALEETCIFFALVLLMLDIAVFCFTRGSWWGHGN